jgi:CubicO group peptidase (beta-lactamase class C family)
MRKLPRILTVLLILFAVSSSVAESPVSTPKTPDYWPTEGWRASTPEEQGMDSELLARAMGFVRERNLNVHSLLVIRNGYIVADAYFYPFSRGSKHDIASVTKSFTSTLIGIAIDKGHIKSVNQPVLEFFPQRTVANLDENKKGMTLEDLLTMSSGLACISDSREVTLSQMMASPDWVQFMLDLPMSDKPGTRFVYNSGGSHLLSAIIRESTGMNELAFAEKHLFGPLGISDVIWPLDPQGVNNRGWGDLRVTPHDMAKLGYLYLNEGRWDGKQIVSAQWVAAATSKQIRSRLPGHNRYGYQWWIRSSGNGYSAVGRGGQRVFVLPDKKMVVVTTSGIGGDAGHTQLERLLQSFIIPAAKSSKFLQPNPTGVALLESRIRQAALSRSQPRPAPPLPQIAAKVSGQTYVMDANSSGLVSCSLTFRSQEEAVLGVSIVEDSQTLELRVGLNNVYRISPGRFGLPAAARGFWQTDNVFALDLDEAGNINRWRILMTFRDDRVTVVLNEATALTSAIVGGKAQTDLLSEELGTPNKDTILGAISLGRLDKTSTFFAWVSERKKESHANNGADCTP